MRHLDGYFETSSIHGLAYLAGRQAWPARLVWLCLTAAAAAGCVYVMEVTVRDWYRAPVVTSVEVVPLAELKFPDVSVCPHGYNNMLGHL